MSYKRSKVLITRGQQVGTLAFAEIATAAAELGLDETDLEAESVPTLRHGRREPARRSPAGYPAGYSATVSRRR